MAWTLRFKPAEKAPIGQVPRRWVRSLPTTSAARDSPSLVEGEGGSTCKTSKLDTPHPFRHATCASLAREVAAESPLPQGETRSGPGWCSHDQAHRHRWRADARLSRYRLHARRGHGRCVGRRPHRRRLLRCFQATQPFPRDSRRGRLQRGLRAGLCADAGEDRATGGAAVRRPHRRRAARHQSLAWPWPRLHPLGGGAACARPRPGRRALRSRRDAHPRNLSLSAARVDANHDLRRAERQWQVRGGGRRADPAQHLHGRDPESRLLVP